MPGSSASASSNASKNPPNRLMSEDREMHRAMEADLKNESKRRVEAELILEVVGASGILSRAATPGHKN